MEIPIKFCDYRLSPQEYVPEHEHNAAYLLCMSLEFTDKKPIATATHWIVLL